MKRSIALAFAAFSMLLFAVLVPAQAKAQGATPAPDAVQLHNGGLYLGTILELVPGDHVVIRAYGGVERTIPWRDVAYAGPATHEPPAEAPASIPELPAPMPARVSAAPSLARVSLEGGTGELSLELRSGTRILWGRHGGPRRVPTFTRLCAAPCVALLPSGLQPLAVSLRGDAPVLVRGGVEVRDGARLRISYESRHAQRVAGVITVVSGVIAGLGMILGVEVANATGPMHHSRLDRALLGTGGGLVAIGLGVGLPLVMRRDRAHVDPIME